jgi:hypothetical protein
VVRLTFDTSVEPLHLPAVVQKIFGGEVTGEVPVYIEAWGGAGGDALEGGGTGGAGGYARSSYRLSDLLAITGGEGLYLYIGEPGNDSEATGEPAQGGASTVVSTRPIMSLGFENQVEAPADHGVVLIAGGGGGAGAGTSIDGPGTQPGIGGEGGVAIATTAEQASCGGANGSDALDNTVDGVVGGQGGNGGDGGCGASRVGAGGASPIAFGAAGVGGVGGVTGAMPLMPRWSDAGVLIWKAGEGGASQGLGGGGGGGFGGGGNGGESLALGEGAGGGGGGSWSRQSTIDDTDAPVLGALNPAGRSGAVTLTFDVCAVRPESLFCVEGAELSVVHANTRTFDGGDGVLQVRINGDPFLAVSEIDTGRLVFGHAMVEPIQVSEPTDLDGDGIADLELLVDSRDVISLGDEAVHCLYGAMNDAMPFVACSRVEALACTACSREECVDDICVVEQAESQDDDDSCAINPRSKGWGGLLLALFGAALLFVRRHGRNGPYGLNGHRGAVSRPWHPRR